MRYKGNQYKCTELGFTQLHQTNTTGYNGQIGPDTTTLGDCNIPVSSTNRSFKKNQQCNFRVKPYHGSNGLKRRLQNIPSTSYRTHILHHRHGIFFKVNHILASELSWWIPFKLK